MAPILAITCPSGKQCSHLIPLLLSSRSPFTLRLAAHSEASAQRLRSRYPGTEVVVTDLTDLAACQALVRGIQSLYLVLPSLNSREKEAGFNIVDACVVESQRPGNAFQHLVFAAVHSTQHRILMQHDLKSFVEERIFLASALNYTILKPCNFMDAYPVAGLAAAAAQQQQSSPLQAETVWSAEMPNSVVALRDLAEASAKVLREGAAHYCAEYPLCSTMPIADADIYRRIGAALGRAIELRQKSFDEAVDTVQSDLYYGQKQAEGDIRSDLARDAAERLVLFYRRRGLRGSPNVLRWLLGREPTTVDEWIQIQLKGEEPILHSAVTTES